MKHRKLLLAAVGGTGILAAFASQALPLDALRFDGTMTDVVKVDSREHRRKGHHEGHRRHDDDDRQAANDCRGRGHSDDDDDHDDDDGRAVCGGRSVPMQQNANPPSNSLFTPGSKPRAQMN